MAAERESPNFDGWDAESMIVVTSATLAIYNSLELLVLIGTTFKRWKGLYFYSLVVASLGVIPYFVGFILEYLQAVTFYLAIAFSTIGWCAVVTGQSLVLYSRLGLLINSGNILRIVKWMIITNAIVWHTSITVIQYGKGNDAGVPNVFDKALFYLEKTQMTVFCIQEFILSGLYLWKTTKMLKYIERKQTRRVMIELLIINVIIVVMDVGLLVLEYDGLRIMERTWKGLFYSIKLKLEFAILGKLIDLVQRSKRQLSTALEDVSSFVDLTKSRSYGYASSLPTPVRQEMPEWVTKLEQRDTEHVEKLEHDWPMVLNGPR